MIYPLRIESLKTPRRRKTAPKNYFDLARLSQTVGCYYCIHKCQCADTRMLSGPDPDVDRGRINHLDALVYGSIKPIYYADTRAVSPLCLRLSVSLSLCLSLPAYLYISSLCIYLYISSLCIYLYISSLCVYLSVTLSFPPSPSVHSLSPPTLSLPRTLSLIHSTSSLKLPTPFLYTSSHPHITSLLFQIGKERFY